MGRAIQISQTVDRAAGARGGRPEIRTARKKRSMEAIEPEAASTERQERGLGRTGVHTGKRAAFETSGLGQDIVGTQRLGEEKRMA